MSGSSRSGIIEWMKLVSMVVAVAVVVMDVLVVRSRNKSLQNIVVTYRTAMHEQKVAFEKRIKDMQDDFNSRMDNLQKELSRRSSSEQNIGNSPKMIRCSKCSGKGTIQVKVRCGRCGGSGRIRESYSRWKEGDYIRSGHYSTNTRYIDCPSCLPNGLQGSGSKGYTLATETCQNCHGSGKVELK